MNKELIILTIDLGDKKDEIHIKSSDTPLTLSQQFCKKHSLEPSAESAISYYISQNLLKLSFTPCSNSKSKSPQNLPFTIQEAPSTSRLSRGNSETQNKKVKTETSPLNKSLEPGQRLYYKAVEKLREKEERLGKILAEREANEVNGLTFRPNINKNSVHREKSKLEDEFISRHQLFKEKLKFKLLEKEQDELKDCTFRPDVNRSSSKIDKVKAKDRNLHLYYSAERKRKESEKTSEKKIGKRLEKKSKRQSGDTTERVNLSETVERLMKYQEKYSSNKERIKARKIEEEKYDKDTGRELFRPCVNTPKVSRKRNFLSGCNSSISGSYMQYSQKSSRNLAEKVRLIRYEEVNKK